MNKLITEYPNAILIIGLVVLAELIAIVFIINKRKQKYRAQPAGSTKEEPLQADATPLYSETEAPLERRDAAKLLSTIRKMYLGLVLVGSIIWAIIYFIAEGGVLAYSIYILFMLLLLYAVVRGRSDYMQIAKEDKKIIFRGVIADRIIKEEGSGDDKNYKYYLMIGGRELEVGKKYYDRYPAGQAAEIHFVLQSNGNPFIFRDKII